MKKIIMMLSFLLLAVEASAFLIIPTDYGFQDTNTGRNWRSLSSGYFMSYNAYEESLIGTDWFMASSNEMVELQLALQFGEEIDRYNAARIIGQSDSGLAMGYFGNGGFAMLSDRQLEVYPGNGEFWPGEGDQAVSFWATRREPAAEFASYQTAGVVTPEPATILMFMIAGAVALLNKRFRFV